MARRERLEAYGRNAWLILFAAAALGIFGGVSLLFPKNAALQPPNYLWIIRAWGITWIGFNIIALVLSAGPYRRGERWAWYTLWLVPLLLLSYFVLAPHLPLNLVLALITAAFGLILPYHTYFSDAEQRPSRVRSILENPSPGHSDE